MMSVRGFLARQIAIGILTGDAEHARTYMRRLRALRRLDRLIRRYERRRR